MKHPSHSLSVVAVVVVSAVLALLAAGTGQVLAADFYVGGAGASDRNPGTASQPFATIQKAAGVAAAGDFVNIRSGVYRETVVPANSGAPGQPVTFQPDGDAEVTVSGADLVDGGWTVYSGQIYQKAIALPLTGYGEQITDNETLLANQVFVGGRMMIEARWPNLADSDDLLNRADFRPIAKDAWTARTGGTAILRDADIPEIPGGWAGGTIWYIGWYAPSTSTITGSSAGQIEFSSTASERFRDFYYLTGKLGALDAEKEWFYGGSKLYLWAPGGGAPKNVEVKRRNYAFDLSGKSNITIRNLDVFAATITTDATSADITLDGLRAKYISHFVTLPAKDVIYSHSDDSGIRLMGSNSVIRNSIVEYSAGHGIVLGGEGCVADNNLIHDISYGGTYCCAIFPAPGNARQTITGNTIYRTGRSGIDGVYSNKEIAYNDIYEFGLLNTDLGAIYSARNADLTGTRIHHNWLHDAGNDASHPFPVGAAIYFDQNAKPAQIDHNVFWNNHMNDVRLEQAKSPFHRVFNNTMASTDAKYWFAFHSYPGGSPENLNNNIYRTLIKPDKPGTNEMTAATDPRFTNAGAGGLKFRLRPDSPAIDRGAVIPCVTDGYVGSAPDIGAYEYGGEEWVTGCADELLSEVVFLKN
ncbi:right-handed parallel beta-helix repeat-containing protein [Anaerobaca lacustris]|uniref:Right-handed parallel beta-helix repeat-containing protein n=1 Tax=Anaerobaca lacustris TaxID=3044600 RepID=A0AAW6U0W6_9BACT|nr:right-handed parallel beta-helix repeat-containing protein [Sedimentisphaerales bacterium M17dextr]